MLDYDWEEHDDGELDFIYKTFRVKIIYSCSYDVVTRSYDPIKGIMRLQTPYSVLAVMGFDCYLWESSPSLRAAWNYAGTVKWTSDHGGENGTGRVLFFLEHGGPDSVKVYEEDWDKPYPIPDDVVLRQDIVRIGLAAGGLTAEFHKDTETVSGICVMVPTNQNRCYHHFISCEHIFNDDLRSSDYLRIACVYQEAQEPKWQYVRPNGVKVANAKPDIFKKDEGTYSKATAASNKSVLAYCQELQAILESCTEDDTMKAIGDVLIPYNERLLAFKKPTTSIFLCSTGWFT